jgi:hypothetical protein
MSEDLIAYLGIGHYSPDRIERVLAGIPPHRRAAIERRARYTRELRAWRASEAARPTPPTADGAKLSLAQLLMACTAAHLVVIAAR